MNSRREASRREKQRKVRQLSDLSLTAEDYRDLRRQGTVCSEDRRGKVYFKLRFRNKDGRQRVRYLGGDRAVAESIRRELQELQLHRRHQSDLRQHDMEARKLLRQVKQNLAEAIAAHGFHFHGFAIRRRGRLGRSEGYNSQITD